MNSFDYENSFIFQSIHSQSMEFLNKLLKESCDQAKQGKTASIETLLVKKIYLLGTDVNSTNRGFVTPLYEAVDLQLYHAAEFLIENGADVNLASTFNYTPLHVAVRNNDFEMVSMLLYYGADTDCRDYYEMNPFVLAIATDVDQRIIDVLAKYETFDYHLMDKLGALPIVYRFLHSNLQNCLEYLKLLFSSDFINDMIYYYYDFFEPTKFFLFETESIYILLISSFRKHQLSEEELLPFICITLSSGIEVTLRDVAYVYRHYGNNKILDLFLHANIDFSKIRSPPLLHLICHAQEDMKEFLVYYYKKRRYVGFWLCDLDNVLDFHTPSSKLRKILFHYFKHDLTMREKRINERVKRLITPSLMELSRDAARTAICKKYTIKNYHTFCKMLDNLPLPNYIKDVINLKVPVNPISVVHY